MSVRLRLKRTGTRNASCFRIVAMDSRSSRDGRAIEEVGFYNPRTKEEQINLDRVAYWVSCGAVVSETVADIAQRAKDGVILKDRVRKASISKKAAEKIKAEEAAKVKAAADAAKAKADAEAAAAKAKADAEAAAAAEVAAPAEA